MTSLYDPSKKQTVREWKRDVLKALQERGLGDSPLAGGIRKDLESSAAGEPKLKRFGAVMMTYKSRSESLSNPGH